MVGRAKANLTVGYRLNNVCMMLFSTNRLGKIKLLPRENWHSMNYYVMICSELITCTHVIQLIFNLETESVV